MIDDGEPRIHSHLSDELPTDHPLTASQIIHTIHGCAPHADCADRAPFTCWVCGGASSRGMDRVRWMGSNYTAQTRAVCPASSLVCEACVTVMAGRPPDTERMWSHLVEGREHGPWFITPHAVTRYVERIRPGLAYESALRELIAISDGAHAVKEIEPGLWLWRGPRPRRLRLRVSTREPGLPQLVTVLTAHDGLRAHR